MVDISEARANIGMVPAHCADGLLRYIENGETVGGFLTALLCCDLKETFARADDINGSRVRDYLKFLYNYAPAQCWGSREAVDAWQAHGGLVGLQRKREGAL